MAFLKGVKKTVEIPVTIAIPILNDKDEEEILEIHPVITYTRFKRTEARKIQAEVAQLGREAAEAMESGDLTVLFNDRLVMFDDLIRKHVKGWRKMPGSEDDQVPFSAEALEEAIEDNYYFAGFMAGLRKALGWGDGLVEGSEEEERKNS